VAGAIVDRWSLVNATEPGVANRLHGDSVATKRKKVIEVQTDIVQTDIAVQLIRP